MTNNNNKVLILEQGHHLYAQLLSEHVEVCSGNDPEQLCQQAAQCSIWLGQPDLLQPLLVQGLQPQWLQSTWAGITPLLAADLPRGYQLTRAVGIFGQVMAEYVLGHILAHQRQLFARRMAQQQQRWDASVSRGLAGCTALIVGCGEIGQAVAQFLQPFGITLLGVASSPRAQAPFKFVEGLERLEELLPEADFVINLLPDTPRTRDVFSAKAFAAFKPSALLINAGRGVTVVDDDLVQALAASQLAGAVIDVCREEPLPAAHPFWTAPYLLLTGHSAAPTDAALMARLFLCNLERWRQAQPLLGQVNFSRGY